jgi:hypothetical protein
MPRLLLLVLLLIPLTTVAQTVYRTTDAQGNVVFTDRPPANATPEDRVDIRPTNTVRPPEVPAPPPVPEETAEVEAAVEPYRVAITNPANETSFPMGPGNFSVNANVNPALRDGYSLQLFFDGAPRGEPQQGATWDLTNVFRGRHDLTVGVIGPNGETITLSDPVTVFVFRPSTNFANRQPPAKPRPPRPTPK